MNDRKLTERSIHSMTLVCTDTYIILRFPAPTMYMRDTINGILICKISNHVIACIALGDHVIVD